MAGELTVSERILYHLNNYLKYEDKYEVPFDITQDGISQSCSISRAHAAIELKKLKAIGIIEEKLSHVRRGKARRKVYLLTQAGKVRATKVAQYVRDNDIKPMVDATKISPELSSKVKSSKRSTALPTVRNFFGRSKEMSEARGALSSPSIKVLSIRGIAGIGKTTIAAKLCSELADQRVFWYSAKSWDAPRALEDSLAKFFFDNGLKRLSSYLSSGNAELGELSFLLNEELSENGYVFVFDDADVSVNLQEFLSMFRQSCGSAKIMATSDSEPRFYERSDVVAKGEVVELELGGLENAAALELLKSRGIEGSVAEELAKSTNGHPLSLEMVTASTPTEARYQLSKFLEEKFYSAIPDAERSLLQFASVFPRSVPAEAIPRDLKHARKGSMLREVSPGRFEIHASLRDFVYSSMTDEEKGRWHSAAADYYLKVQDKQERLYHLIRANRRLEAEMLAARSADELLGSGNVERMWELLEKFEPSKAKYKDAVDLLRARVAVLLGKSGTAWKILESISHADDMRERSEVLVEMGMIRSNSGDLESASKLFSEALEKSMDAPLARSKALRGLGVIEGKLGNYARAQELLERSALDALAAMDNKGMLLAHMELGNVFIIRGMHREAIEHFSKCAAGFGPVELAGVYTNMGEASASIGGLEQAQVHLANAAKLSDDTGQPRMRARALTSMADVLIRTGKLDQAKESCFAALEVLTGLDDKLGMSAAYASLGLAERLSGNLVESENHYRDSIEALERVEAPKMRGLRMLEFGILLREKGDLSRAADMFREARDLFKSINSVELAEKAESEISSTH